MAFSLNDLLKFIGFVSENAVNAKVVEMKFRARIYSGKQPESITNAM